MFSRKDSRQHPLTTKRLFSALVVALLAAGAAVASPAAPAHAEPDANGCTQLLIIGVRGAGVPADQFSGMGQTPEAFMMALREQLPPGVSVAVDAVKYPAPPLLSLLLNNPSPNLTVDYDNAVEQGVAAERSILETQSVLCPDQRFVLVGDSMGADVTGRTVERLAADGSDALGRIAEVSLFGDPRFDPAASEEARGGGTSKGIVSAVGISRVIPELLRGHYTTSCFPDDIICQSEGLNRSAEAHGAYTARGETLQRVYEVSARLATSTPPPQRNVGPQGDRLTPGQYLLKGDYLDSANGQCRSIFQTDGNLVTYRADGSVVWFTGPTDANRAVMQRNGVFELQTNINVRWVDPFRRAQIPGTTAVLQDDCNLVGFAPDNQVAFATSINKEGMVAAEREAARQRRARLEVGAQLNIGQTIESPNGACRLAMQPDGNIALYRTSVGEVLWASYTDGKGGDHLAMQPDGNLVLYRADGSSVWDSATSGSGAQFLAVQDDCNVVLYTAEGRIVQATNTDGGRVQLNGEGNRLNHPNPSQQGGFFSWFIPALVFIFAPYLAAIQLPVQINTVSAVIVP
jgi:hypothetical protein